MPLLFASIGALLAGPVIYRFALSRRWMLSLLDGFIFVTITGLVVLYILPGNIEAAGWWAIPAAAIGMFGPSLSERLFHRKAEEAHLAALVLGLSGIVLHSFVDGAALVESGGGHGHAHGHDSLLPTAIILHQLPVALAIWWLLRPIYGFVTAMSVLVLVGGAIAAGYGFGPYFLSSLSGSGLGLFEAFVAGSLLHVVFHQPHADHSRSDEVLTVTTASRGKGYWHEGAGALIGILLLTVFLGGFGHEESIRTPGTTGVGATFITLALESAPALLIAYLLAGLLNSFLPASSIGWIRKGAGWQQSLRGMAVGLPFPICSCGVVPLYRTLIRRGAPPAAAMAFLVSTPELGLDAILISIPLLGSEMTLIRIAAAALTAFLVGWVVGGMMKVSGDKTAPSSEPAAEAEPSFATKLRSAMQVGFGEVVDHTAPWILAGLAVAAVLHPFLDESWLTTLPSGLEIPLFALLGLPMYVCASGATPLVAVLMAAGVSPGAALAFLLTGPATNVTTFGLLGQLHGRSAALLFSGAIIFVSVSLGFAVNALFPGAGEVPFASAAPEEYAYWQIASALLLGAVYALSLLRRGARRFCAELLFENRRAIQSHPHSE